MPLTPQQIGGLLQQGFSALNQNKLAEAEECCRRILTEAPKVHQAHFLVGLISLEQSNLQQALKAFTSVVGLNDKNEAAWAHIAKIYSQTGHPEPANQALDRAVALGTENPTIQDVIGSVYTWLGHHPEAVTWYFRAFDAAPNNAGFGLNLANGLIFVGDNDRAQKVIDQILKTTPEHPQAHWILSTMRKAKDGAHAALMEELSQKHQERPRAVSSFCYAAGKEYEDLEEWDKAIAAFQQGADNRRRIINYNEETDDAVFEALQETFTEEWIEEPADGYPDSAPIFIVGQPRTGTTLIDRIISSHSRVTSAGELQQVFLSLKRLSTGNTPNRISPELIREAGNFDPAALGEAYVTAAKSGLGPVDKFVDKMPVNFLYVPLIAKALPNAKIVHLVRNPMDACFASFKQLFAEAYLHSYDQEEMARHFVRYHRLMNRWRALLGDRIIDVSYEETVSDLEPNARRLIDRLGLEWEPACLTFHENTEAVSTASAVQVRQPAHTKSVGRWKRYETELAPMRRIIEDAGISVE